MSPGDHDPSGGGRKRAGRSAFGKPAADTAPASGTQAERARGRGAFAKTLIATPGAPKAPAHGPAGPPEAAPGPADGRSPQRSRYTKTLLGAMPPAPGQPAVSDAPRRTEASPQPPVPDPLREPSDRPTPARFAGGSAAPTQPQERSPRPHAAHNGAAQAAQTPRAAPTLPMNTVRAAVAESRQGGQGPAQAPSSSKNGATDAFAETARKRTGARPPSARPKPAAGSDSEPLKLQLRAFDDLPPTAVNTTARVPTNRMPTLIATIVGGLAVAVLVLWMLARGSGPPTAPAVVEEPAAAEPGAAQEAAAVQPPQNQAEDQAEDQAEHEADDGQTGKAAANTGNPSNGKAAEPGQAKAAEPKDAKASKADRPDRRAKRAKAAAAKAKERARRARKPSRTQRKARQPEPKPAESAPAFAPSEEDQASIEQARQALDALQQGTDEPVMRIAPSQDTPSDPSFQGARAAPPPPPPPPPPEP